MRAAIRALTLPAAAIVFSCVTQSIYAQGNDQVATIQQKLRERITLATLDSNGNIATAGSVVALKKGELQMCATSAPPAAGAPANTYRNGTLSAGLHSWRFGLGLLMIDPNTIPMRTLASGEKFWIVHYNVTKTHAEFKIWTDADANSVRYWTWLVIPFDKKQVPSPEEFMNTLAEVLAVEPAQGQASQGAQQVAVAPSGPATNSAQEGPPPIAGQYLAPGGSHLLLLADGSFTKFVGAGQAQGQYAVDGDQLTLTFTSTGFLQHFKVRGGNLLDVNTQQAWARSGDAPAAPASYQKIAPPPPPPAAAPTISIGQTKAQVTAAFGEPQRKATVGPKEIFFYTDMKMKVTFTNGKVSNLE